MNPRRARKAASALPDRDSSAVGSKEAAAFAASAGTRGALAEAPGLYKLFIESVRDYAIFALDPDGYIISWNAGAERIKGYTAEEIIGRHFSTFYGPEDLANDKPGRELEIAIAEGRVEDEGWRIRKDGTKFWANVIITALRDERGALVGFAKVTRDLTERKAAQERELADARRVARIEAANRAKSEFLASMSHELRTPLNAISGYTELIEMGVTGEINDLQREYLQRIRSSQQHLLGVINDLLNYSRIEAGQLTYAIEAVSLPAVLDSVLTMVTPQANKKGITLTHGQCDEDVIASADRLKTEQIALNLFSNAVKFTPEGGQITAWCDSSPATVSIRVRDNGPGIPADKLDAIFEPFVQVGRSLKSMHEGVGLGLAISRDLARAMGGDIVAESTLGHGSTFTVSLPKKTP